MSLGLGYDCEILKGRTHLNVSFEASGKKQGLENLDVSEWRNLFLNLVCDNSLFFISFRFVSYR